MPGGLATPTRNRYFYGKLLDAVHLELEQEYVNGKRWLLNQYSLGWGVLRGLDIVPTSNGKGVAVGAGVAIDPFGREIIVPTATASIDIRTLTDESGQPTGEVAAPDSKVTLCLAYLECPTEFVPALTTCGNGTPDAEASRVQECYRLILRATAPPDIQLGCAEPDMWATGSPLRLDYPSVVQRVSQGGPERTDGCVPLARMTVPPDGAAVTAESIDQMIRPVVYGNELLAELVRCLAGRVSAGAPVAPTPPQLTVIAEANWMSRGSAVEGLSLEDFRNGLVVDFTEPVTQPDGPGQGWFLVTLETLSETNESAELAVVRVAPERIGFPDPTRATFMPHPGVSDLAERLGLPLLCRVVLKCGVLLDSAGNPVDGDYSGNLPTGDGVAGGDFESWFILDK